ncbi:MAG: ATP-binding protein [Sediminibacterium sp.]|nr:ATP-binding protein [Sediminibacterium sp.]
MVKIVALFIVLITSSYCYAQINKTDSLKNDLDRYTKMDTIKIKKMLDYSNSLFKTNAEKSIQITKEALVLADKLNWKNGQIDALLNLGQMLGRQQKFDKAFSLILKALKFSEAKGDREREADAHHSLSEGYRLFANDSLSNYHAQKMLAIATTLQNKDLLKKAFLLVGAIYFGHKDWVKADSIFNKALKIAIEQNDERTKYHVLYFKALKLYYLKNYNAAIKIYKDCLGHHQKEGNYPQVAYIYASISSIYTDLNSKDSAYFYANAALQVSKKHLLEKELMDAYGALAYTHHKFKDYKNAFEYRILYDSLFNKTYSLAAGQNAEKARMQTEQEKKDALAKIEEIKKENATRRTRNLQFTTIVFFMLLAGFLFWNNRQKQKSKLLIEKAYSDLKATQSQLIQSEKMASLGELTAGIAHEIQNPLNFVNNFSEVNKEMLEELKAERVKPNAERDEHLQDDLINDVIANSEKINHHGKRADAIVKGMLQHSRSSRGVKEPTDINVLADEYLRLAYHGLRAKDKSFNATLITDFDDSIGKINMIPQDIGRVILNLITNAFYAVAKKKKQLGEASLPDLQGYNPTVTITTRRTASLPGGSHGATGVLVSVKDNGNGIPQHIKDKIFQPFFTTKPTGEGTGLGLSLSYDIVKALGGEIKVVNSEGEGTTFDVYLPNE